MPLAHETWFVPDYERFGLDWAFVGQTATLALLAAAAAITVAVRVLARRFPGVDIPFLARLAPWMPFAIRMHLAVSLVGLLSLGFYLSPAMDLHANLAGLLGDVELMGHLPIYGTMLVLLVMGSDPRLRPLVSNLRPPPK